MPSVTVLPTANTTPAPFTPTADAAVPTPQMQPGAVGYTPPIATRAPTVTLSGSAAQTDSTKIMGTLAGINQSIAGKKTSDAVVAATKAATPPPTQQQQDATSGYHNMYGYDGTTGARLSNPNVGGPANLNSNPDPLASLANDPEPGHTFAYNTHDGTRINIPLGTTPEQFGLSRTPPTSASTNAYQLQQAGGITSSIPLDHGNAMGAQVGVLANGTYAALDANGNFVKSITKEEYLNESQNSQINLTNQRNQASSDFQAKWDGQVSGSIPLEPWQQDQINGIKNQYAELIAKQSIANANFEGGTRTLAGLTGNAEYAPGIAQGNIKAAVDEGISKIASLTSELGATVSKMTAAFRSDNRTALKEAYDEYQSNVGKRQAQVDKMQAAVAAAKKEQDTVDNRNADNIRADAKNKQDYELAKGKDSITAAHDKAMEEVAKGTMAINKAKLGIEGAKASAYIASVNAKTYATQLASRGLNATGGLSGINADGTVNKDNVTKILASVPQGIGDAAKNVLQFKSPLTDIKDAKTREAIRSVVLAINPNYDTKQYGVAKNYLTDYSSTKPNTVGGAKVALNAMAGHIDRLSSYLDTVDSSSFGFMNSIENTVSKIGGPVFGADKRSAIGSLGGMKQIFSEENLKYLKGSAAGETAVTRMQDLFSGSLSKEEAQGAVKGFIEAINDKTNTLLDSQKTALGYIDSAHPIMYGSQSITLDKLGTKLGVQKGSLDNVLSQTPEGQLYLLAKTPDGAKQYVSAKTTLNGVLGRDPSADEILQAFPQLGVQRSALHGALPDTSSDVQMPPSDNSDFNSAIDNVDTSNQ